MMSHTTPIINDIPMIPQTNLFKKNNAYNNNNNNNDHNDETYSPGNKANPSSTFLPITEARNTSNEPVKDLDEFDMVNLPATGFNHMVDGTTTNHNLFSNPFDDNTLIASKHSNHNMASLNRDLDVVSANMSNSAETHNTTATDKLTPISNGLTKSESTKNPNQQFTKNQIDLGFFNSAAFDSQREISPGINASFGSVSPSAIETNLAMDFSDTFMPKSNNKMVNLEEPSTNLDDLFNSVTSTSGGPQEVNDQNEVENELDEVDASKHDENDWFFLTNSLSDVDDQFRRHSDFMLNSDNAVPTMTPTSRASISHQFDMWSGLQKTKNPKNSLYNRARLQKTTKKTNINDANILRPTPNRQNDKDISNMLNGFNLSFTDPFDKNNDLSESNTGSNENVLSPSSPKNERRFSVRKAVHRGSVPAIDVEILRRLSTSAGMTPSSNFSSSENGATHSGNLLSNFSLQGSLSNNSTPKSDDILHKINNVKTDKYATDNFHHRLSPDYAGTRYTPNNNSTVGSRMGYNDPYNSVNASISNNGNNNNDPKFNPAYMSMPQRTVRSASVANTSSNRMASAYPLPTKSYSPPPSNLNTLPHGSFMAGFSPACMTPQQQTPLQNQIFLSQQNQPQSTNQVGPMNSGFKQFAMTEAPSPIRLGNVAPPPPPSPQQQHQIQNQPIMNLPIQPIAAMQTLQQPSMAPPNLGQPMNGLRVVSASTTVVKPNGNIDMLRTDDKDKPYKCEQCGKAFKRSEHLKRHIRSIHNQERPFTCLQCNKKFSRNDNLQQHIKIHERNAMENRKEKYMSLPPDSSFT